MVRVVTAAEAAARDAAAIDAGTPSRTLMQRAGAACAAVMCDRMGDALASGGVLVVTGPGNNGGDGWVVAHELAGRGIPVRVVEVVPGRTDDARAARAAALPLVALVPQPGEEGVVVDALLGTGARPGLDASMRQAVARIEACRARGAAIVALDLPTGVDASTGTGDANVVADLTVSFGTIKRGHLLARGACGDIVVVDIGLGAHTEIPDGAPALVDGSFVAAHVPPIAAESHKGVRRRVAIAGGTRGMAGACILAGQAAVRSGAGMVRLLVEEPSLVPAQVALPEATAITWPAAAAALEDSLAGWAHAILVGPGLGRSDASRELLVTLLDTWQGPTVLDADALNHFAGDTTGLAERLGGRPALITPHAGEMARLLGIPLDEVLASRFDVGAALAQELRATVLLKGVPTVVFGPDGRRLVSATGTPALAAAGSGDVLGGIAVTLLAQTLDPFVSAACAAWVHGRAAEVANAGRMVRGVTLGDVLSGLSLAWWPAPERRGPVLAELWRPGGAPARGGRA
jgi:NAD(P)H-hydrate epimerase